MRVADIILDQLGGNKFLAMTGAHHLLADGNTLRMQLTRNKSKTPYCEIFDHLGKRR